MLFLLKIISVILLDKYWLSDVESIRYFSDIEESEISVENIKKYLGESSDIIISPFRFGSVEAHFCCVDGLVKESVVDENVLAPFLELSVFKKCKSQKKAAQLLESGYINHTSVKKVGVLKEALEAVLASNFVLIFEKAQSAFVFDVKGFEMRSIDEPESESVVKGSKDGFTEPLRINTAIVRRHIKSTNLIVRQIEIGSQTKTTVALIYMKNIAPETLPQRVESALKSADISAVCSLGQIESALCGKKNSIVPKILYTERADKLSANILNGRVGVIVDGFPTAFIAPSNLAMFMQTPEDYSQSLVFSSFLRIIRYLCLAINLFLPAFYLAVVNFSPEILPAKLASSIIKAKYGMPFSAFTEVFVMLIAFEILIEAGLRLPNGVGQAVSIVSGIIVGDAAINANIASPAVVMLTAAAGITSFVLPYQALADSLRVIRFILMIIASFSGLFGVYAAAFLLALHLNSVECFGLPYLSPFASGTPDSWFNDTIIRRKNAKTH